MRLPAALFASLSLIVLTGGAAAEPSHAIAMHGEPALPADYDHFPYANPDAPQGGTLDYGWGGTFDSVNPFIVQGEGTRGLNDLEMGMNVFEPLMMRSYDEPFTLYPLIAKSVDTDEERTFVAFEIDERAAFSDGEPVRPEDVIFTFDLLAEKGRPNYARLRERIRSIEKVGERGVRFTFDPEAADRELPLIIAMTPVLPEHAIDPETFDRSTLKPIIGTGPYILSDVRVGERVVLTKNPDYWAKDHPSKRGFDNFDEIVLTYFRDGTARFESFKKGLVDLNIVSGSVSTTADPESWTRDYDFPAVQDGRIVQSTFKEELPSGMRGFVMNTRREPFDDRKLREALFSTLDFATINRALFAGAYDRMNSYFAGSELASTGTPASEAERDLLADYGDAVLPSIMDGSWSLPSSDGSGRDRAFMRDALSKFKEAGYRLDGRTLVDGDGEPLSFEILLNGNDGEAVASAWKRTLVQLGIQATIRPVDNAQYFQRRQTFDYDVIIHYYSSSLSPGREQIGRWGSQSAGFEGSFNFAGASDPAIDAMIDAMLSAVDRDEFETAVHAYDRVLLSGFYVIPLYYLNEQWIAHSSDLAYPAGTSLYGYQLPTWWSKSAGSEDSKQQAAQQ